MKILVVTHSKIDGWNVPADQIARLQAQFPDVRFVESRSREQSAAEVADADVLLSGVIRPEWLAQASRLRWVHSPGTGVTHMLSPRFVASPVLLTNARGIHATPIAEHAIGLAIALFRKFDEAMRLQLAQRHDQDALMAGPPIRTLRDRTLGVIGLGQIGGEIARLGAAFGMRVVAVRRRPEAPRPPHVAEVFGPAGLRTLLGQSDVVVLATPLTPATGQLLGAGPLSWMKRDAVLVNIARGQLVDEAALVAALREGRLAGAGLDAIVEEPLPADSPLWDAPHVIITPHVSWATDRHWEDTVALFADNLKRFLAGADLRNVVDKVEGY